MKYAIMSLMTTLLSCFSVSALNYNGTPFNLSQPDGDSVSVRLFGDDLYIHAESFDGYTLIKDPDDGFICYAMVSSDSSEYASSGIRYRGGDAPKAVSMIVAPHARISFESLEQKIAETKKTLGINKVEGKPELRAATALPDTVYGVTVLIDFPDCKFPFSIAEIDKFLNGEGSINGNARSIKEYFRWVSNGKLTYINYLPKSPYTAPNEKAYYSPSDASSYTFSRLEPLVNSALNSYSKAVDGFDVKDITVKNGAYYAVNILYAGACPSTWATGLWPHKGSMSMTVNNDPRLSSLVYQPYQLCACPSTLTMGPFVHETMHLLLGVPDFYAYDNHTGNTAEPFNVADEFVQRSNKNPPIPNPWIMDDAGWLDNKIVLNNLKEGTKVNLEYGPGNVAVYYGNVDGDPMKERYYVEVRSFYYKNKSVIATPGIYIWHVYEPGDNRYSKSPDKLDCRPASSTNPFWSSASPSEFFSDNSDPSAKWNNGENSGIYLCNFSDAALKMSFCYGICEDDGNDDVDQNVDDGDTNDNQGGGDSNYDKLNLTNRDSLPSGKVGEKYYAKLNPVGGDGNYSIKWKTSLPDGLSLNSNLEIVGTPKAACDKMMKLLVYDGTGAHAEVWLKLVINENAAVDDCVAEQPAISVVNINGEFVIATSKEETCCAVYTMNGIKIEEFKLIRENSHIFGSNYPTGVYIVSANGRQFKIMKY